MIKGLICLLLFHILTFSTEYTNTDLNLRSRPDTGGDIIAVIPYRKSVKVIQKQDGWAKVEYDGKLGYVCGEYIQEEQPPNKTYLGNYLVTAYEDTGCTCANGNYPSVGYTVAHNTLPFGARLYIDGVGERVVEDRGPGYLGSEWLDLYLGDAGECYIWGEKHLDVYLLEE